MTLHNKDEFTKAVQVAHANLLAMGLVTGDGVTSRALTEEGEKVAARRFFALSTEDQILLAGFILLDRK